MSKPLKSKPLKLAGGMKFDIPLTVMRDRMVRAVVSTKLSFDEEISPFRSNLSYKVGDNPDHVRRRRQTFIREFEHGGEVEIASGNQIHSANARVITSGGEYPDTDALVTASSGVVLTVSIADCYPVLIHAPGKCIAAVHAGWRGTVKDIVGETLAVMKDAFGVKPKGVEVLVGAGAGACCYEIKNDVASLFDEKYIRRQNELMFLDLRANIIAQLKRAGVSAEKIESVSKCTVCDSERYHSFRRDGVRSGRMLAAIALLKTEGN